jgi:hypothetical protein
MKAGRIFYATGCHLLRFELQLLHGAFAGINVIA